MTASGTRGGLPDRIGVFYNGDKALLFGRMVFCNGDSISSAVHSPALDSGQSKERSKSLSINNGFAGAMIQVLCKITRLGGMEMCYEVAVTTCL